MPKYRTKPFTPPLFTPAFPHSPYRSACPLHTSIYTLSTHLPSYPYKPLRRADERHALPCTESVCVGSDRLETGRFYVYCLLFGLRHSVAFIADVWQGRGEYCAGSWRLFCKVFDIGVVGCRMCVDSRLGCVVWSLSLWSFCRVVEGVL